MKFIDTHTHLYSERFADDLNEVIDRAIQNDITEFILPAIDSSHLGQMKKVKNDYPQLIHLMAGLHPTSVDKNFKAELKIVEDELKQNDYVAVGEIGIDLYWEKKHLQEQQEAFHNQIELSLQHELPFVIHCRDAFDEVFEVLDQFSSLPHSGVFHCFSGNQAQAEKVIDMGLYLGIGGIVTFKNGRLDQFLDQLPLEKVVLETDAPYLAPTPFRGKRNESAYILNIAQKVAELYHMPLEEVARITTDNAMKVFNTVS